MALPSTPGADAAAFATWWQAPTDWFSAITQNLFAIQRAQWDSLSAWQQAVAATQQEMWDEWVCRWAGGAPLGD